MITSVNIAEWGPCCSTAPTGMITVEEFSNQLSSSLFVSSPRNTVGAFITENRSDPLERLPALNPDAFSVDAVAPSAIIGSAMLIYLDANIVQYCADNEDFVFGWSQRCDVAEPKLRNQLGGLRQLVYMDQ